MNLNRRLKIGLAVSSTAPIPDVLGGGAERLVTMLADQNEVCQRADLVIFSIDNKEARRLSEKYENTAFVYIKKNHAGFKFFNGCIYILNRLLNLRLIKSGYYHKISNWLKHHDIDLVIDENGYVPELMHITKVVGKERLLSHIHWKVLPINRGIDSLYGGIIGVSKFVSDAWSDNSSNPHLKKMVVFSAVDEKRFEKKITFNDYKYIRSSYGINEQDIVFLYCGRLQEQKGSFQLIEAFQQVPGNHIKLLLVGSASLKNSSPTEYESKLRLAAQKDSRIIFTGYIPNDELYQFYQISDVQVIPTLVEEAAGLVAIEGMLSGLPIIATNSGGLVEYICQDCALLIHDLQYIVQELSDAIEKLANDSDMRKQMSKAARARSTLFSQQKYYNDFMDAIEDYYFKIKG